MRNVRSVSLSSLASALVVLFAVTTRAADATSLPALHADGTRMVDATGKPVTLRGCNLGNWLMIEPWMLGNLIDVQDQGQLTDILGRRFGAEDGMRLTNLYRENYVTPRDLELI